MRFLLYLLAAMAAQIIGFSSAGWAQSSEPASKVDVDAMVRALSTSTSRGFDAEVSQQARPSVTLRVNFELGSAVLTEQAQDLLQDFTLVLKHHKLLAKRFEIVGHTDARGSAAANQSLSEQRAQAVVDFLTQEEDVRSWRVTALGRGESELLHPEDPNNENNRRVEIIAR